MAKSNCPAEDSASPQASAGQLTPCFLPLSLSGRLLQVTVAISPPAAKGASKGTVVCAHPIGSSPQTNAGFQKVGERGVSAAKQKLKPSGSSDWTSGRGSSVRFGPASWSSLVIEFCQLREGYLLPEKLPFHCVFKRCICWGPSGLRKPENSEALFRNIFFSAGIWVAEVTSE